MYIARTGGLIWHISLLTRFVSCAPLHLSQFRIHLEEVLLVAFQHFEPSSGSFEPAF